MPRSAKTKRPSYRRLYKILFAAALIAGLFIWYWHSLSFPRGLVIHHSASHMFDGERPLGAEDIERWHAERGFETVYKGKVYHIGYHYIIRADGVVESGLPEGSWGSHAKKGNDCLGICLIGDFSSIDNPEGERGPTEPTPEQLAALERLCRDLMKRHYLKVDSIRTHRQVDGDTECPGDRFPFDALLASLHKAPSAEADQ